MTNQTLFIQTFDSYQIHIVIYTLGTEAIMIDLSAFSIYLIHIWNDLLISLMHLFKNNNFSILFFIKFS